MQAFFSVFGGLLENHLESQEEDDEDEMLRLW